MKTKEFIKSVEELGYKTQVYLKTIRIVDKGCFVAAVDLTKRFTIETTFISRPLINEKLFDLIVEYARTPVDEREEEKYYLVKFSEKEIEKIKEKYDTDLSDFELIEVEE